MGFCEESSYGHKSNEEEVDMPKVGSNHFSYTKKGKKAAKRYAKKTGQTVSRKKKGKSKRKKSNNTSRNRRGYGY